MGCSRHRDLPTIFIKVNISSLILVSSCLARVPIVSPVKRKHTSALPTVPLAKDIAMGDSHEQKKVEKREEMPKRQAKIKRDLLSFLNRMLTNKIEKNGLRILHSHIERRSFICDTVAAMTLTWDSQDYSDSGTETASLLFATGVKTKLQGQGIGTVAGTEISITYSPELQVKLLSISSFLDQAGPGAKAVFTAQGGKLISNQGIYNIKRDESMYFLDSKVHATYFVQDR